MVDGSQQEYVLPSGLPYAICQVTIHAFNIKRGVSGPSEMTTHRSIPIGEFGITHKQILIEYTYKCSLFPEYLQSLLQ